MLVLLNNCQLGTLITGESLKALQQIGFKLTLSYVSLYLSESLSLCPFFLYVCHKESKKFHRMIVEYKCVQS